MADASDPPAGTPWTNRDRRIARSPADLYSDLAARIAAEEAESGGGPSDPGTPLPGDTVVIVDGGEEG